MAGPNDRLPKNAPRHIRIEKKKNVTWLPWLLLALGLLALLFALSRCTRNQTVAVAPVPVTDASAGVVAATPNAATADALAGTSGLGTYLAGKETAPRTFVFEKLNFEPARHDIRPADAAEVSEIATVLKQYPSARIRIAGYADANGSDAANLALGKARADSMRSALIGQSINAERIEAISGGETDPVDTNATSGGRFENRRTELVVTKR